MNASRRLDLWSFLDCPRRRLSHYPLLLQGIRKRTLPGHADAAALQTALEQLRAVVAAVDRHAGQVRLRELHKTLVFGAGDAARQQRDDLIRNDYTIVKESQMVGRCEADRSRERELHVLLLDRMLLVTHVVSGSRGKGAGFGATLGTSTSTTESDPGVGSGAGGDATTIAADGVHVERRVLGEPMRLDRVTVSAATGTSSAQISIRYMPVDGEKAVHWLLQAPSVLEQRAWIDEIMRLSALMKVEAAEIDALADVDHDEQGIDGALAAAPATPDATSAEHRDSAATDGPPAASAASAAGTERAVGVASHSETSV